MVCFRYIVVNTLLRGYSKDDIIIIIIIIIIRGHNITCSTNCKYRTAATLYALETRFFRYIIVNTLHRGYNKDGDNNNYNNNVSAVASNSNVTYYGAIFLHVRTVPER